MMHIFTHVDQNPLLQDAFLCSAELFVIWLLLQIGETQIFLRAGQMAELDARRAFLLSNSAIVIQKHTKTHFSRKKYIALQKSSVFLQSICRGQLFVFFLYYVKDKKLLYLPWLLSGGLVGYLYGQNSMKSFSLRCTFILFKLQVLFLL